MFNIMLKFIFIINSIKDGRSTEIARQKNGNHEIECPIFVRFLMML